MSQSSTTIVSHQKGNLVSAVINKATTTYHGSFFVVDFVLDGNQPARVVVGIEGDEPEYLIDAPEAEMAEALKKAAMRMIQAIVDADG